MTFIQYDEKEALPFFLYLIQIFGDRVFDVKVLTQSAYYGFKNHIAKCRQLILCEICGESFKGKEGTLLITMPSLGDKIKAHFKNYI